MALRWTDEGRGCVVARCGAASDLSPGELAALVQPLRTAGKQASATALVLEVDPAVRTVDPGAPGFWMQLAQDREVKLAALALVSNALAVRAAARGFGLAQEVMAGRVMVDVFNTVAPASEWAERVAAGARPASTPTPTPPARTEPEAPVVWSQAVEGLARAVGVERDPQLLATLAELGFDLKRRAHSYPREAFLLALDVVATQRWGNLPAGDAMVELGKVWVHGFSQTLVGRAQLAFVHALGPRRAVQRLTQTLSSANNYTQASARELAATDFEVKMEPVFRAGFFTGILTAGLEVSGAKEPVVKLTSLENLRATYHLTWKAR